MTETNAYSPFPTFSDWTTNVPDWSSYEAFIVLFDEAKQAADSHRLEAAVRTATRIAAIDTGAIEGLYRVDRGFTLTVATETAAWQVALESKGETAKRAIEDAINAYEYILDLATQSERLTEAALRELHSIICASQDTYEVITSEGPQQQQLPKGEYKRFPNNPVNLSTGRTFHYAPVADTAPEMQRFVHELNSNEFKNAHPVVQSSYAHYAFVRIHPFADGNGRVARAIASIFLYRNPGIPLVIYSDQKGHYLDALELADQGAYEHFIAFINEQAIDTLSAIRTSLIRAPFVPTADSILRYQTLHTGNYGLSHAALDAVGERLKGLVTDEIRNQFGMDLGDIKFTLDSGPIDTPHPDKYRRAGAATGLTIRLQSPYLAGQIIELHIRFGVLKAGVIGPDLIVQASDDPQGLLEVRLREIHPEVGEALKIKVREWAESLAGRAVGNLVLKVESSLKKKGYL